MNRKLLKKIIKEELLREGREISDAFSGVLQLYQKALKSGMSADQMAQLEKGMESYWNNTLEAWRSERETTQPGAGSLQEAGSDEFQQILSDPDIPISDKGWLRMLGRVSGERMAVKVFRAKQAEESGGEEEIMAETSPTFGLRTGDMVRHKDEPERGVGKVVAKSSKRDRYILVLWADRTQQRHDPSALIKEK